VTLAIEWTEGAWYEAATLLCSGTPPPFVPCDGDSRNLMDDADSQALVEYFLQYGPSWTTGIGAVEACDVLVGEAVNNGNLQNVSSTWIRKLPRVAVRGARRWIAPSS